MHGSRAEGRMSANPIHHNCADWELQQCFPVACEERLRLTEIYRSAIQKHNAACFTLPDIKKAKRGAKQPSRRVEAREAALEDLNAHRKEHGC
jgi:hypothetical protein